MHFPDLFLTSVESLIGDETAFVICNTKAEKYLLEKIAYHLHNQRNLHDYQRVAVEYSDHTIKRADLVVVRENDSLIHVEAKYYYSFDRVFNNDRGQRLIASDVAKLKQTSQESYFMLFLIHYGRQEVPRYFKYARSHNRLSPSIKCAKKYYLDELAKNVGQLVDYSNITVGAFMDVPVQLLTFIVSI